MEYSAQPAFKNPAWREKKLEARIGRHGKGRPRDKEEGELFRKSDKHERRTLR